MSDNSIDYDNLNDDELQALETGGEVSTPEVPATPAEVATPEPVVQEQQAETPQQPAPSQVPLTVLIEERRARQAAQDQLTALQQERAQAQQQAQVAQQQAREQAEYNAADAEYQRLLDEDPAQAAEFARQWHAGEAQTAVERAQAQADARVAAVQSEANYNRLAESANMARLAFGAERFDAAYNRLTEQFGVEWVEANAAKQQSPGSWVVEFAEKALAPTAESMQAQIDKAVEAKLKEVLGKNHSPPQRGHNSIGHIASKSSNGTAYTDAELENMSESELRELEQSTRR